MSYCIGINLDTCYVEAWQGIRNMHKHKHLVVRWSWFVLNFGIGLIFDPLLLTFKANKIHIQFYFLRQNNFLIERFIRFHSQDDSDLGSLEVTKKDKHSRRNYKLRNKVAFCIVNFIWMNVSYSLFVLSEIRFTSVWLQCKNALQPDTLVRTFLL